jgi:nitrile hydratase
MTPVEATSDRASTYTPAPGRRFNVGDAVVVKRAFPPGHRRTPCYIRGKSGVIERICGAFPNPEELAYGFDGEPKKVLYRVRFLQKHVWPDYRGPSRDIIEMEIFEHWLEPASEQGTSSDVKSPGQVT